MRKLVTIFLVILVATSCKNEKLDIDVETVWANYLKQFGDTAQINKVRTLRCVAQIEQEGNNNGSMELIIKDGKKMYTRYKSIKTESIDRYDGENFVRITNGEKKDVSKTDQKWIIRGCDFFHELHYKKHGFSIKLIGKKTVNNIETYEVKYYMDDMISFYYLDAADFHVVKIDTKDSEFWPLEIKELNGFRYFSKYKIKKSNGVAEFNVTSLQVNSEVNDSIFR